MYKTVEVGAPRAAPREHTMTITTEAVWHELHDNLRAFVARRVPPDDVDDLLQDIFVRIHRGLPTVSRHERLHAWVYQLARNVVVDHYRARGHRLGAALDQAPETMLAAWPETDGEHAAAVREELAVCLQPLLEQLPADYRQAVALADLKGETQRAIAERLGLSLPGLKSRVQRGRARLRDLLGACCQLEFDQRGTVVDCHAHGPCCQDASAAEQTVPPNQPASRPAACSAATAPVAT